MAVSLAALSGCQLLPEAPEPPRPAPVADQPEAGAAGDVTTVVDLLQRGRFDEAREVLAGLAEREPNSWLVARLSRLVDAPVEALIPPPYREIRVRRGQTLSEIADRRLGDPLMFIALARLNDIDVPSRLPAGARLKVPEETGGNSAEGIGERSEVNPGVAESTMAESDSAAAPVAETDAATETETVAEFLALSGRPDPARTMLRGLVERGEASETGTRRFVELTLDAARAAMEAETFGVAADLLSDAELALRPRVDEFPAIESLKVRARAGVLMQQARAARERDELVEAYGLARRAATVAPAADRARQLAVALRASLIDELHNEALIAWRDRDVDRAIRTWETLLQAVPDFEPAEVYLQRARRLRSRLDNP